MALPALNSIDYTDDYVSKNNLSDGAIKKLDTNIQNLHGAFIDEDDMASNSNAKYPSQQSVKAYVDDMTLLNGLLGG